jgi:parvulin-like peptidyl-prolyl isomerase
VRQEVEPQLQELRRIHGNDQVKFQQEASSIYRMGIDNLVEKLLILQDYEKAEFKMPEDYIEDYIKDRVKERFGDRLTMTKSLQAMGSTYESYRRDRRDDFLVEVMMHKNISSVIVVSPFKIETFYKEHEADYKLADRAKLRMIVLNKRTASDTSKAELGRELIKKLGEGVAFSELATIYSDGPQKADGGMWGWEERDQKKLKDELFDEAFKLKAGEHSGVIETADACFILFVEEYSANHVRPLVEVAPEIERILLNLERERLRKRYIEKLKRHSFVRYIS